MPKVTLARRSLLAAPLLALLPKGRAARPPLRIVASFSVLADLVRQVAGDQALVESIVGPGGDVHEYEPRPSDLEKLARADLIVLNGLTLDDWMRKLITASGSQAPVVVAGARVVPRQLPGGITDPHGWHDPENALLYVEAIAAALARIPGLDQPAIAARAAAYGAQIRALEQSCAALYAPIPPARRRLVTSHDAFGYYAARFGLTIVPVRGVEDAEPSAQQMAALATRLKSFQGAPVFLENLTNPALLRALAAESGARIGGTLYADSLSAPDGPAGSYLAMIRFNTETIVRALSTR